MSLFVLKAKKYVHQDNQERPQTCSVCNLNFTVNDQIYSLPCGHFFHEGCLQLHLAKKTFCPLCKLDLIGSNDDIFGHGSRQEENPIERLIGSHGTPEQRRKPSIKDFDFSKPPK